MNYKIPKKISSDFDTFDENQYRKVINNAHNYNVSDYNAAQTLHAELVRVATLLYGEGSRQLAYIIRETPESPPDLIRKSWKPTMRAYSKWLEKQSQRQKAKEYRERVKDTNDMLEDLGYIPDEYYKSTKAITFAKQVVLTDEHGNPIETRALPSGE